MNFDIFFSLCQNQVRGQLPSEKLVFRNFFDQVLLADSLEYDTAWLAESHLSSMVQKQNGHPVIPHFEGEVGLNTNVCQIAHLIYARTQRIEVGSAIRNILCNGGPLAHAEDIRTFLSLHSYLREDTRKLHIGFAAGRFEYSNKPYGINPRNEAERLAWKSLKHKIFLQAVEIFLRSLRGDSFSSEELEALCLYKKDFPSSELWNQILRTLATHVGSSSEKILFPSWWNFETLKVIPQEAPLTQLSLTIGSHDPETYAFANHFLPCKVFHLSITPPRSIEDTHLRMQTCFHPEGGVWKRSYLPRTVLIFLEADPRDSVEVQRRKARESASEALENYWKAIEGTLDPQRIEQAVENSLCGCPEDVVEQIQERFHPEDRLMLWFDFNCHDNEKVKQRMRWFQEKVIPFLKKRSS